MPQTTSAPRVSARLIITFSMAAIIIAGAGILAYRSFEDRVRFNAYKELSALAKIKIREVTHWQKERNNDASFIHNNEEIKRLALKFLLDTRDKNAKKGLADNLRVLKENHEYPDILIIDTTGKKYSLFSRIIDTVSNHDREYFGRSLIERKIMLTDLNRDSYPSDSNIHISSFIPMLISESRVFSIIEIKIDPAKALFPAIQMSPDHNATSETFLVRKDGDSVLFLNELKYRSNTALKFKLPLSMLELPATMAVRGKTGIFEGKDYRGVPVIADLQKIPDSNWFIVSKIDKKEAYSALRQGLAVVAGIAVLMILLSGVSVYLVWKHQQIRIMESGIKSELERKTLQDRIDYIVKNANDAVIILDDFGNLVQANDKASLVYGYTLEEFTSLNISDLRAESARKNAEADMKKVRENDGYIFETIHLKKDGTVFPVEVSSRIINVSGRDFFQSIIRDITERKAYEEKLKNTITELNRSNKDLEQFAYVASHDLQEPLRMVHTFSQLLNRRNFDKLDENSKQYISFLTEGAQRMQQLIQALLTYSRLNAGPENFDKVDCNEALNNAKANLSLKINESNASIISPELPAIMADYSQMVQLFQNLLSNAIKYRSLNKPEIRIKVEERPGEWLFSIRDNGIGISTEYYEKIFLIFQRLHDRDKYEGTGIGLTICKRIVERHGGRIWVESMPGKGSAFYFSIKKLSF